MSILSSIKNFFNVSARTNETADRWRNSYWSGDYMQPFDGEKTPFELGQPKEFVLDYYALRARAWESYIKSDVVQNAIKKYVLWLVGSGLKIQSTPVTDIINDSDFDRKQFVKSVENSFRLYAELPVSSYNRMNSTHELAAEALKNAMLAGDVLVLLRYNGRNVTVELIDGYHIQYPYGSDYVKQAEDRGNEIHQGVEINKRGEHVAFYVRDALFKYRRIKARGGRSGRLQAWLFYGLKHKITDVRGMSLLTAVMETAAKMDRYKEATVGTAEENAKLVYSVEHDQFSDGENPMINNLKQSFGRGAVAPETDDPQQSGENVASKIAATTNKQAYNLPRGAKINQHGGKVDIHFADFFGVNSDLVYATLGIPPEVAMDKFGGAYSGSRAALKSWEYKMMVDRMNLLNRYFYKPIFDYWFDIEVINNRLQAPGYLDALLRKDFMRIAAYKQARFIGSGVPHIDPVKEVNAERGKLGGRYKNVPLSTGEQAAENLNTGDFSTIMEQAEMESEQFAQWNRDTVDEQEPNIENEQEPNNENKENSE